jgi:UDP-glucose 4-epimerase
MARVLVTGGSGFIGSYLCDFLLAQGHEVVSIDNGLRGREANLEKARTYKAFTHLNINILQDTKVADVPFRTGKFDAIFHLAANSDIAASLKDPMLDYDNTFNTTFTLLRKAWEYDVPNFIFSSTSAIFGDIGTKKVDESHGPLSPVSHYGAAKLASEAYISSFANCYNIKSWIIRFPNVIAEERMTHGCIHDFFKQLDSDHSQLKVLGNGTQNKPYIHVSDLINAINFIWLNSFSQVNVFNVSSYGKTSVKFIAEYVAETYRLKNNIVEQIPIMYGKEDHGWIGDVNTFEYDVHKLHNLGFTPRLTSNEAVGQTIRNFRSN